MSEEDAERRMRFIARFMEHVPHLKQLGIDHRANGPGWAELEMPYAPHLVAYPDNGVAASPICAPRRGRTTAPSSSRVRIRT